MWVLETPCACLVPCEKYCEMGTCPDTCSSKACGGDSEGLLTSESAWNEGVASSWGGERGSGP